MKKTFLAALLVLTLVFALCLTASAESGRYDMYCGMAAEPYNGIPVAAWVHFDPESHEILYVHIAGAENPDVNPDFLQIGALTEAYVGMTAEQAADAEAANPAAEAVRDACARYLAGAAFSIRPYETMVVDRYIANNPHFDALEADAAVETSIVAAYPEGCLEVVTEDVLYNGNVTWPLGVYTGAFTYGDKSVSVTHNAVLAKAPGVAVIAYSFNGETVLDAVDIYPNFTLYPEPLSGSDAYGQVVAAHRTEDTVTYIALGDKAMNFPGGTAGSTIVSVKIDIASRTIAEVLDLANSDSPYLANEWEYNGGFTSVGLQLYAIGNFTSCFAGRSAEEPITRYGLSSSRDGITGGVVVDGGIDYVVTGATRTPNAIISAVNAVLEAFATEYPAK